MKKPDLGKRLIPLMDMMFLLLIFFIILPHGIRSNELLQIETLKKENQEMKMDFKERNKEIRRNLEYYRWQYGTPKEDALYTMFALTFRDNQLYIGNPEQTKPIPLEDWESQIKSAIKIQNANLIVIQVKDVQLETSPTTLETFEKLASILDRLQIRFINIR
jgi:biopolymer transport protein ExbD